MPWLTAITDIVKAPRLSSIDFQSIKIIVEDGWPLFHIKIRMVLPDSLEMVIEFARNISFLKKNSIFQPIPTICHQFNRHVAAKTLKGGKLTSFIDLKWHRDDPEISQNDKGHKICRWKVILSPSERPRKPSSLTMDHIVSSPGAMEFQKTELCHTNKAVQMR